MNNPNHCVLTIKLTPKSSSNKIVLTENLIRVYVAAPPQNQAANQAACELIAKSLKIAFSKVWIVSGHSCRDKKVYIEGLESLEVGKRLGSKWGSQLPLS